MKLDMDPLPKSNLDRAWVGQTKVVWAQYWSHWIQQWLVVLEADLVMAMVDISVQIWPSESEIWIVKHFSTWEDGLLGAIHTVSVSGSMLSLEGGQSHERPWFVICGVDKLFQLLGNGKAAHWNAGMGMQASGTESMLLATMLEGWWG